MKNTAFKMKQQKAVEAMNKAQKSQKNTESEEENNKQEEMEYIRTKYESDTRRKEEEKMNK